MELVTEIYRMTETSKDELYGLVVSSGGQPFRFQAILRKGTGGIHEMIPSIGVWRAFIGRVEMQIEIAKNLDYVSQESCSKLLSRIDEVGRLLTDAYMVCKAERSG